MREPERSKSCAFELGQVAEKLVGGSCSTEQNQFAPFEGDVIKLNGTARIEHFATDKGAAQEGVVIKDDVLVLNEPVNVIHISHLKIESLHIASVAGVGVAPTCRVPDNA